MGERVASEIQPAAQREAATHGDQDSEDEDAVIYNDLDQVVCHCFSLRRYLRTSLASFILLCRNKTNKEPSVLWTGCI